MKLSEFKEKLDYVQENLELALNLLEGNDILALEIKFINFLRSLGRNEIFEYHKIRGLNGIKSELDNIRVIIRREDLTKGNLASIFAKEIRTHLDHILDKNLEINLNENILHRFNDVLKAIDDVQDLIN